MTKNLTKQQVADVVKKLKGELTDSYLDETFTLMEAINIYNNYVDYSDMPDEEIVNFRNRTLTVEDCECLADIVSKDFVEYTKNPDLREVAQEWCLSHFSALLTEFNQNFINSTLAKHNKKKNQDHERIRRKSAGLVKTTGGTVAHNKKVKWGADGYLEASQVNDFTKHSIWTIGTIRGVLKAEPADAYTQVSNQAKKPIYLITRVAKVAAMSPEEMTMFALKTGYNGKVNKKPHKG